jgi:hypothetical protein
MIERQKGVINFVCDGCGEFIAGSDGEEFGALWGRAKEDGWRGRKRESDGLWQHQCGDCGKGRWPE